MQQEDMWFFSPLPAKVNDVSIPKGSRKTIFRLDIKVTRHLCFKDSKNLRLLDILACDSTNFKIAELQARMSRRRRSLLFLNHKCL